MPNTPKLLIRALEKEKTARVPFWYMRQAGRYLPEYQKIRNRLKGFWDLVFNPDMASEVTLQPISRFKPDAAIIFSDILTIPYSLGQSVVFVEKKGPVLSSLNFQKKNLGLKIEEKNEALNPIFETVRLVKKQLSPETALIGFAGSPWTVATYMIEGKGQAHKEKTKKFFREEPILGSFLIRTLIQQTVAYLKNQIASGADVIQLFDSWAGALDEAGFYSLCVDPTRIIVSKIKEQYPETPIIGYPKGVGEKALQYFSLTGVDGIGVDHETGVEWAANYLQPHGCVQGNLDPLFVVRGGREMLAETQHILGALAKGPHIFNLGHGMSPMTPPEHVEELSDFLRTWKR